MVSANIFTVSEPFRFNTPDPFFFMASEFSYHLLPFNTLIHMISIKLSSSNYLLWKSQLLPLFESQDMLGYVDGTMVPPPRFEPETSSTHNPKYLAWRAADQRLLYLLLSSLTVEAIAVVVGLSTARDVWLALETTFNHHSKALELRLKDDLQLMKRGTKLVAEYTYACKTICDQLHTNGRPIEDIDKVHWFLRGLSTDFLAFSTAQMALTPIPCFADLVSKAESFELFQSSLEFSDSTPTASTATNRGRTHEATLLPLATSEVVLIPQKQLFQSRTSPLRSRSSTISLPNMPQRGSLCWLLQLTICLTWFYSCSPCWSLQHVLFYCWTQCCWLVSGHWGFDSYDRRPIYFGSV